MKTRAIDVPEELLTLLQQSRLADRPEVDRVRYALAIHLFEEGVITIGKAAELVGEPLSSFELLLGRMGIPVVRYELSDYEEDIRNIDAAERRARSR